MYKRQNQLLARSKRDILDAYANQDVSFDQLVDQLKPTRSLSHTPVFQLYFDLQQNTSDQFELEQLTV